MMETVEKMVESKYGINNTCQVCGEWKAGAHFDYCTECHEYKNLVEKSKEQQKKSERMKKRINKWGNP